MRRVAMTMALVPVLAACTASEPATSTRVAGSPAPTHATPSSVPATVDAAPAKIDPRKGGFEVGLGEWAVTLEAEAIRPGPVTFVVRNGGTMLHGFEMEIEGAEGDSSGPGSGDGFKYESATFGPGERVRFRLNLQPGLYKVECLVDGHDDRGMEAMLRVRRGAPLIRSEETRAGSVSIEGFRFAPSRIEVGVNEEVTWTNRDPAEHTVTADGGPFSSDPIATGGRFRWTFERPGRYAYLCAIHPEMRGTVIVR